TTDSQLTKVTDPVTNLQAHNDRFRAEKDKVKQHSKQLYGSIKITRAKHIEQVTKLTAENVTLKTSVKAVATACYTQNRSLIHSRRHKTPYKLVHNKKPDLTFFIVFGALCYPTNDSEDLRKLQLTADTGIFVGYAPSRKGTGPAPTFLTPGQISSGLVPNPHPATPYAPPTNKDLEILFQPMFDEYLEPPRAERPDSPAQAVQVLVSSAGTPLSTTIDQDAPSLHISPSSSSVVAEPPFMEDHHVAPVDNNPFVNVFASKP
nr:hypothetical protein [Tanacetum cinerariifolium]